MTGYLAWLMGVQESDVMAYRDTTEWPSHWTIKAQYRMRSLGVSSEREALDMYRTQYLYG
jgi:hypothetical protein